MHTDTFLQFRLHLSLGISSENKIINTVGTLSQHDKQTHWGNNIKSHMWLLIFVTAEAN